jgi:serine/threonine protein kinase
LLDDHDNIRLIDFGLAINVTTKQNHSIIGPKEVVGTALYMAPEMGRAWDRLQPFGLPVDWWAFGVMAYTMLGDGHHPLPNLVDMYGENVFYAIERITGPAKIKQLQDPIANDLVSHLLTGDPVKRFGFQEIRGHGYFANETAIKSVSVPAKRVKRVGIVQMNTLMVKF